jgi:hypothetical protein
MNSPDQNPDIFKRRPVDISQDVWDEHLAQVKHITNGIREALPYYRPRPEELDDLVSEALVYLLEHKDSHPYWTGARMATKWKRDKFPSKHKKGKCHGKFQTISFSELSIVDDEGNKAMFEETFNTEPEDARPDHPANAEHVNMDRVNAWQMLASSPEDFAVVMTYFNRKHKRGNRFTRAESVAFESAMRRLKKLGRTE